MPTFHTIQYLNVLYMTFAFIHKLSLNNSCVQVVIITLLNVYFSVDIPVLDADEAGRAVPKLEMLTPYIYGCKNFSSCLANGKGNVVAISRCDSAQTLETMSRDICVNMG